MYKVLQQTSAFQVYFGEMTKSRYQQAVPTSYLLFSSGNSIKMQVCIYIYSTSFTVLS